MKVRATVILCSACALFLVAACRSNPHYNPAKSHHTESGFRNNYAHPPKQSFWKWQWRRWTGELAQDPPGGYGFPLLKPDVDFLATNRSDPTLTWIGHASFLLQIGGVNVLTDPHLTARTPWDANQTLWGSWVVEPPRLRFFFGGDFGYSQDLADIGKRFGRIVLAALPIGAYEPRWFMRVMHVNPEEAVRAMREINARYAVAMHWGTFRHTDELLDEPLRKLAAALENAGVAPQRFFVMQHGETRKLDFLMNATEDDATR